MIVLRVVRYIKEVNIVITHLLLERSNLLPSSPHNQMDYEASLTHDKGQTFLKSKL